MKYIVYLTTNKKSNINNLNKIYIGVHKTENPNIFDGYIGCGVFVQQPSTYKYPKTPFQYAVKKYGTDSFKREILYVYDTLEDAYKKEGELVDLDFIKQDHVYNAALGGLISTNYKPLYQFDLTGKLLKFWEISKEAHDFYGYLPKDFNYAVERKLVFLDCFWSNSTDQIDITEFSTNSHGSPVITHLYSKNGKWLNSFNSRKECAEYINVTDNAIKHAIRQNSLINKEYYVSNSLYDEYKPKAKNNFMNSIFYVYENKLLVGSYLGKEVMPVIGLNSWNRIRDIFSYMRGWYKNFYISLNEEIDVENIPSKKLGHNNGINVDVYTKYGEYIETLSSVKEVREKYKVPSSKIKNIQQGDKYYENWIFKYNSGK